MTGRSPEENRKLEDKPSPLRHRESPNFRDYSLNVTSDSRKHREEGVKPKMPRYSNEKRTKEFVEQKCDFMLPKIIQEAEEKKSEEEKI